MPLSLRTFMMTEDDIFAINYSTNYDERSNKILRVDNIWSKIFLSRARGINIQVCG